MTPFPIPGMIARNESGGCGDVEDELVPVEDFNYHNKKMGCLLKESMDKVFFHGVSVSHETLSDVN